MALSSSAERYAAALSVQAKRSRSSAQRSTLQKFPARKNLTQKFSAEIPAGKFERKIFRNSRSRNFSEILAWKISAGKISEKIRKEISQIFSREKISRFLQRKNLQENVQRKIEKKFLKTFCKRKRKENYSSSDSVCEHAG